MSSDSPSRSPYLKWSKCANDTFGDGSILVRFEDPETGGTIDIRKRPGDAPASVVEFFVPEGNRGKGGAQRLMAKVLQEYPSLMGQCSSKASAAIAYKFGRRPVDMPEASLEEVFEIIREQSSVNLVTPDLQLHNNPDCKSK